MRSSRECRSCGSDHRTSRARSLLERGVEADAHRADDDDHREHRVVLPHVERVEQDVAGAGLARDHLAGDHGDQRQHQAGAAAGEDFRQRRRQHDADHALRAPTGPSRRPTTASSPRPPWRPESCDRSPAG